MSKGHLLLFYHSLRQYSRSYYVGPNYLWDTDLQFDLKHTKGLMSLGSSFDVSQSVTKE